MFGSLMMLVVGQLRQLAKLGQVVRHALLFGQVIGELGQDARRHGDVTGFDVDPRRLGKGPNDRQKGVGRKQRRLVGQRVDDGRLLGAHVVFSRRRSRSDSRSSRCHGGYQYRVGYDATRELGSGSGHLGHGDCFRSMGKLPHAAMWPPPAESHHDQPGGSRWRRVRYASSRS